MEREYERLPAEPLTQDVLGVPVRKVVIQVVAGRNIAVLVEAAVRNTILQLRGIDTYQEFVERHRFPSQYLEGELMGWHLVAQGIFPADDEQASQRRHVLASSISCRKS